MSADAMLDELAAASRQIEAHRVAIWRLEQRQLDIRQQLIRSGWKPPEPEAGAV
jgi:hypothetical protein